MDNTLFENPPVLRGTAEDKLKTLYDHLFKLSGQLNQALMTVSVQQAREEETEQARTGTSSIEQKEKRDYNSLKSLIIKNAEIVQAVRDEIRLELESQYTAISEQFGEYQQTISAQIEATASGIMQSYNVEERIQGVEHDTNEFINSISQYIYSGVLDEQGNVGIAIGYNVTNPDGTLNQSNKMATFTADMLSFFVNQVRAAYFSNSIFHIEEGAVTSRMRMGSYVWQVMPDGGMGLMKG